MVTTTSQFARSAGPILLGLSCDRSIPTSSIVSTTTGWTRLAGWVPPESTVTPAGAMARANPAAIWLLPAFSTQTKAMATMGPWDHARACT